MSNELDRFIWGPGDLEIRPAAPVPDPPEIPDVPADVFPRPTGAEVFAAKSKAEQDEMLGAEAAEKVRSGAIKLSDLVAVSALATAPNFITQAPVEDAE